MKTFSIRLASALLVVVVGNIAHSEDVHPLRFKVGQKGKFFRGTTMADSWWYNVQEVLSEKEVLVKSGGWEYQGGLLREEPVRVRFIMEMDTKGIADDSRIDDDRVWEVVGTKKIEKKTYFVLRLVKDDKQKK